MLEHFLHALIEFSLCSCSALLESVSLDELRQINFSVFASKRSITSVPTL